MEQITSALKTLGPAHYAEFVGTFIFLSAITRANGPNATLKLSAALALAAFIVGDISGGHMNPAVSGMLYLKGGSGALSQEQSGLYVAMQVAGGLAAAMVNSLLNSDPVGTKMSGISLSRFLAECLGTMIFFSGILASGGKPWVVGLSLYIAANIVGDVSGGHLNPAVTTMQLFRGQINVVNALGYIGSQCAGAWLTLELNKQLHTN